MITFGESFYATERLISGGNSVFVAWQEAYGVHLSA